MSSPPNSHSSHPTALKHIFITPLFVGDQLVSVVINIDQMLLNRCIHTGGELVDGINEEEGH